MNRNYKVIWNVSLNCFMAVAEYAKARGKSSSGAVTSKASPTSSVGGGAKLLRLSALCAGLATAGLTMSPVAFAATGVNGAVTIGVANCATNASAGHGDSLAVGCSSVADLSSDPLVSFYERGNPDNLTVDTITKFSSTAIGTGARATEAGTSLGMNSSSKNLGVALGIQAKSENVAALAIGPAALAKGNTSLALGRQSAATQDFAQAIGNVASATGKGSLAVGHSARAEGYRSIAIGSADIDGADGTDITQPGVKYQANQQTLSKGLDSIAIGSGAIADATFGSNASGTASTAIGKTAKAQGPNTLALGANSDAKNGTAVGSGAIVRNGGLAVGMHADAGPGVGFFPTSNVALGDDSKVTGGGFNVALGAMAVAGDSDLSMQAYRPITGIAVEGENAVGEVSIGGDSSGQYIDGPVYRRITNLAAGAADTDGVNVSQLKHLADIVGSGQTHFYSVNSTDAAAGNYNNDGATGIDAMAAGIDAKAAGDRAVAMGTGASSKGADSIAFGSGAKAETDQSVAIGKNAYVKDMPGLVGGKSNGSIAIGENAQIEGGTASVAIGKDAKVVQGLPALGNNSNGIAIGQSSTAAMSEIFIGNAAGTDRDQAKLEKSSGNIGIGDVAGKGSEGIQNIMLGGQTGVDLKGDFNLVAGSNAGTGIEGSENTYLGSWTGEEAKGDHNFASGYNAGASVEGDGNVALGSFAGRNVIGNRNLASGYNAGASNDGASVEGDENVALGSFAGRNVIGNRNLASGYNAGTSVIGNHNLAMGEGAGRNVKADGTISLGYKSKASANDAIAMGTDSSATKINAIAMGTGAKAFGISSISIGTGNIVSGNNSGAFGDPNIVNGNNSYAVGNNNTIDADNSFVLGNNVTINASDKNSIALGEGAIINGEDSIAIGRNASAAAGTRNGLAIGVRSKSGNHAVSLGDDATSGNYAVALGSKSSAQIGGTAIGQSSKAVSNATALGRGAIAGQSGNVALGNGSITGAQHIGAFAINNLPVAGLTSGARTVSVGSVGAERQIQNVAPGVVDANSTDAINGSQLFATNSVLENLSDTVVANKTHYYSVKDNGTPKANYNNDGATGNNAMAAGIAAEAQGNQATAIGYKAKAVAAESTAVGREALAEGHRSTALGYAAKAIGPQSVAIGDNAETGARSTVAIGDRAKALNGRSIAIGKEASTGTATDAIAFGVSANVKNRHGIAMGIGATSVGDSALAIGSGSQANGVYTVAMGKDAQALHRESVAIGKGAIAKDGKAVSIGSENIASGDGAVAIGDPNVATGAGAVAIGKDNTATGIGAVALGNESLATQDSNIAMGNKAQATGNQSIAQGSHAKAFGSQSIAQGTYAKATGNYSLAEGYFSEATRSGAIAQGQSAKAFGENSIAQGVKAKAEGKSSVAIGDKSLATKESNIALGDNAQATGNQSIAQGRNAKATGSQSIAQGTHAEATGNYSSAQGYFSEATQSGAIAQGRDAKAFGENSIAQGMKAKAEGKSSVAIGDESLATKDSNIALGNKAQATGNQSIAQGSHAKAFGSQSIAQGTYAKATGNFSSAQGYFAEATQSGAIAQGRDAKAFGMNSIAQGAQAKASGKSSLAIGDGAQASGTNSIAIGTGNQVSGNNSGAFGDPNIVNGNNSYAVGNNNTIDADNSFVLGNNVTINASDKNSIALGEGAIINGEDSIAIGRNASAAAGTRNGLAIGVRSKSGNHAVSLGDDATSGNYAVALGSKSKASIGGTAVGQASSAVSNATALGRGAIAGQSGNVALGNGSITGAQHTGDFAINNLPVAGLTSGARTVSVGSVGAERQIQNVAPGVVDANSTDAINGSQLFATNSVLEDLGDTVGNGLNFVGDRGAVINRQLGETLSIKGGAASTATLTNSNIGIRNDGSNGLIVELAEKVDLGANGSVTTGDTVINNNGISILGGSQGNGNPVRLTKDGLFNGGNTIKGVGDGRVDSTSNQAINGSQLYGTAQSIANNFGGGSDVNTDGTISSPSYLLDDGTNTGTKAPAFTNVGAALGNLDGRTTTNTTNIAKGINFGNGSSSNNYALGDTINVKGDSNITSTTTTDGVQLALGNTITVGTAKPVKIDGNLGTVSGLTNTTYDPNENYTGGQAATQEQLSGLNGTLTNIGFNLSADNGADDRVKLGQTVNFTNDDGNLVATVRDNEIVYDLADDITVESVTIGNGVNDTKLTTDARGLSVNQSKIVDVLAGDVTSTSQQAINGSQLFNQGKGVESIIGGTTVYDPTTGTFTNTDIGGTGKNNINDAIGAAYTAAGQAKSTVSGSANVTINKTGPANGPNDYQVVINDDINLDSVTTGNTVMDNAGVAVDDGAGNSSTMTTAGTTVTNADGDTSSYGAGGMVAGNTTDGKSTVVNQDGVSFTDADGDATGPTITAGGIDAGDTVITGVANGEVSADSTDAINGSQLNAVSETANRGFDITTAATGTGTVSGTTVANVAPGSLQTVTAGNNISISQNGIGLTIATNPDLVADSLTTGNTTVNNDGLSFTDGTGAATGPSISVDGINAGNTVVTGVANGEVSADSTDAVNGSQLNTTNNNVANNTSNINKGINFGNGSTSNNYALGNTISVTGDSNITTTTVSGGVQVGLNENIDLGSTGSVTTGNTVVNNNGVTITNGPSLTTNGINAGGQVVTGVADGIIADGSTDAINGGQLNTFGNQVNNALNDLGYRVDEVEDEANAGIAAAMAMSSIPQSFIPGKSLIGGGIATYNGEGAVAVGLSKVSDNGRWVMKITGTADTQGNAGGAIGAGFHF